MLLEIINGIVVINRSFRENYLIEKLIVFLSPSKDEVHEI
jgi:hypothetical protein